MLAAQLQAKVLLMIVENDHKFISSGISTHPYRFLTVQELKETVLSNQITSNMVERKLYSAREFLQGSGEMVVISTLDKLSATLKKQSGLWIGIENPTLDLSNLI